MGFAGIEVGPLCWYRRRINKTWCHSSREGKMSVGFNGIEVGPMTLTYPKILTGPMGEKGTTLEKPSWIEPMWLQPFAKPFSKL